VLPALKRSYMRSLQASLHTFVRGVVYSEIWVTRVSYIRSPYSRLFILLGDALYISTKRVSTGVHKLADVIGDITSFQTHTVSRYDVTNVI
jgi:hypothetical protein